ncbi:nucleotide exchange factor GrpE [Actinopolymorpha sp. B17G11]|uniref:nucleotide exchange factor GrpE n=1 Tax=unclassified Actinopolymorpha TaxID=2627063 RepID=UPI0032D925AB
MSPAEENEEGPVIRDRRRIDPETGEVREAARPKSSTRAPGAHRREDVDETEVAEGAATPAEAAGEAAEPIAQLKAALADRTNDIKRVQAEYLNYKRRVERDREAVRELAVGGVLSELLPVVDDIGRAREHGELEGGFKAVAEALESVLTKLGLVAFGEPGDPFDPRIHEALMHSYADDVDGPTCSSILQPGYRMGERILRPARVAVAEPTAGLPAQQVDGDRAAGPDDLDGPGGPGGADGASPASDDV